MIQESQEEAIPCISNELFILCSQFQEINENKLLHLLLIWIDFFLSLDDQFYNKYFRVNFVCTRCISGPSFELLCLLDSSRTSTTSAISTTANTTISQQSQTTADRKALIIGLTVSIPVAVLAITVLLLWLKKPKNVISNHPPPMNQWNRAQPPPGYLEMNQMSMFRNWFSKAHRIKILDFTQKFGIVLSGHRLTHLSK